MKLLNVVICAEQYEALVDWYKEALDLEVILVESGEYHYTELGKDGKVIVGLTPAKEVEIQVSNPRNNASIMQIEVKDINALFARVKEKGGGLLFGPSLETQNGFYYGAFNDLEGNQIWVIEYRREQKTSHSK